MINFALLFHKLVQTRTPFSICIYKTFLPFIRNTKWSSRGGPLAFSLTHGTDIYGAWAKYCFYMLFSFYLCLTFFMKLKMYSYM